MTNIGRIEIEDLVARLRDFSWNAASIVTGDRVTATSAADALTALLARLSEVEKALKQCHAKSTCMCGSYVSQHGIGDGHSPVSMYDYELDRAQTRISELERLLGELEKAENNFRIAHDLTGNGPTREADRAWDVMRAAGNSARAALQYKDQQG